MIGYNAIIALLGSICLDHRIFWLEGTLEILQSTLSGFGSHDEGAAET